MRTRTGELGAPRIAGGVSGGFGGLVGNQGGIRSAAMLGLNVPRDAFVATATAIALMVDVARVPVYVFTEAPSAPASMAAYHGCYGRGLARHRWWRTHSETHP